MGGHRQGLNFQKIYSCTRAGTGWYRKPGRGIVSECVGEQKDERRRDEGRRDEGRRDERRMLDAFRLATVHLDDRLREKQQRTVQKNQRYLCTSL